MPQTRITKALVQEHLDFTQLPAADEVTEVKKAKLSELSGELRDLAVKLPGVRTSDSKVRASLLLPDQFVRAAYDASEERPASPLLLVGPVWRMGGFGRVRPAWAGEPMAAKEVRLDAGEKLERALGKEPKTQYTDLESAMKEIAFMRLSCVELRAEHVVRYNHRLFVFTRWMPLTLNDLIATAHGEHGSPRYIRALLHETLSQIGGQLHKLRKASIAHCDLKGDNILAAGTGPLRLALGDYGLAEQLDDQGHAEDGCGGTLGYMSPEALDREAFLRKTDLFSLGVVGAEIVLGETLFDGHTHVMGHKAVDAARKDREILTAWQFDRFSGRAHAPEITEVHKNTELSRRLESGYRTLAAWSPQSAKLVFSDLLNTAPDLRSMPYKVSYYGYTALQEQDTESERIGTRLVAATMRDNPEVRACDEHFATLEALAKHVDI